MTVAGSAPLAERTSGWSPSGPAFFTTCLGLAALGLTHALRELGVPFVERWFYVFAWWSYIVLVDGVVQLLSGRSLLASRPRAFALLAVWSAAFWLAFELVNLRLANWYYVGVPNDGFSRGPGVYLAFATVLPGIFETADLLRCLGLARRTRTRGFVPSEAVLRGITLAGVLFLVLPLAFPRYAYPLIWGATTLLAEPWLYRRGERGLLRELAAGDPRTAIRLLAAGACCGLLWESWNSLALSKWIYTVPFFEELKLFEMPVLGFLGFPPFALECYTFARVLVALGWMPEWRLDIALSLRPEPKVPLRPTLVSVVLSVPAILAVNVYTLRATQPLVSELSGIRDETLSMLERFDVRTVDQLHRYMQAALCGTGALQPGRTLRWREEGHLMQVKGMGARGVRWLEHVGIRDWTALALQDPGELFDRLSAVEGPPPRPTRAEVRVWVRGAQPGTFVPCCDGTDWLGNGLEPGTLRR